MVVKLVSPWPGNRSAFLVAALRQLTVEILFHANALFLIQLCSFKSVMPAFAPDLSYAGLAIADGETASLMYLKAPKNEVPEEENEICEKSREDFNLWALPEAFICCVIKDLQ